MELSHLKTFVAVAREGHLTRAAERLFLSQPAVSAQVRTLEDELGVSLFTRTPRGMSLTEEGRVLLAQAEKALDAARDLLTQARTMKDEVVGEARVAINTDPAVIRLVEILGILRARHPQLTVRCATGISPHIVDAVRDDRQDAGFYFGENPFPEVDVLRLSVTRIHVVAPSAWKDRLDAANCWADLARIPWVFVPDYCPYHAAAMLRFKAEGCEPTVSTMADQEDALCSLAEAGVGLTLLPEHQAEAARAAGRAVIWPRDHLELPFSLATLRRRAKDPVIRAIREVAGQVWGVGEA